MEHHNHDKQLINQLEVIYLMLYNIYDLLFHIYCKIMVNFILNILLLISFHHSY